MNKTIGWRRMSVMFAVAIVCGPGVVPANAQSPVDEFLKGLDNFKQLPAEGRALIQKTWAACEDCDGSEFLTHGLAVLSPPFRGALDLYESEQYEACALAMGALRGDANPFLAVNAAVHEIKALVAVERLLEVGSRIDDLLTDGPVSTGRVATHSYFAPEIAFLRGFALLADVQYEAAAAALREFLNTYEDASQRLVVAARQMLMELENRIPEEIGDVVDLMNYSGRRLKHADLGGVVSSRQARIIELLDKLIEDAEDDENSGGGGGSSSGGSGQNSPSPSTPMQDSMLPGGSSRPGNLRAGRRANPGEMWGAMPPEERQRILQALRDSFPSRYRKLVEQYYEELAKKP